MSFLVSVLVGGGLRHGPSSRLGGLVEHLEFLPTAGQLPRKEKV